ncbi:hypothetical protein EDD17DRAFT_1604517 [Pisolithus thermaeus]|nr:hypothetical protein EDD17DRAFT_1604517 [Pisolithus thermaeus]
MIISISCLFIRILVVSRFTVCLQVFLSLSLRKQKSWVGKCAFVIPGIADNRAPVEKLRWKSSTNALHCRPLRLRSDSEGYIR